MEKNPGRANVRFKVGCTFTQKAFLYANEEARVKTVDRGNR